MTRVHYHVASANNACDDLIIACTAAVCKAGGLTYVGAATVTTRLEDNVTGRWSCGEIVWEGVAMRSKDYALPEHMTGEAVVLTGGPVTTQPGPAKTSCATASKLINQCKCSVEAATAIVLLPSRAKGTKKKGCCVPC